MEKLINIHLKVVLVSSQILSILNSNELAIIGAVDNRLTDRLSLIFILIGQLKLEGEPLNQKATYCVNEFINRTSQNKLGRKEIYGVSL